MCCICHSLHPAVHPAEPIASLHSFRELMWKPQTKWGVQWGKHVCLQVDFLHQPAVWLCNLGVWLLIKGLLKLSNKESLSHTHTHPHRATYCFNVFQRADMLAELTLSDYKGSTPSKSAMYKDTAVWTAYYGSWRWQKACQPHWDIFACALLSN